jgi:hypothetical protein
MAVAETPAIQGDNFMSDQKRPPTHHPLPSPEAWGAFCDEVDIASQMLARQVQSPLAGLTPVQYAVGKYFGACHALLTALHAPAAIRDLAALPARAWHRAAWGIHDPLFAAAATGGGRRTADVSTTVFRAMVLKLADEQVASGDAVSGGVAAHAVARALRQAQAPPGYRPSAKSIQNWRGRATNPKTPTDHHLAEAFRFFRPRSWPDTAGETLTERIRWIIELHKAGVP